MPHVDTLAQARTSSTHRTMTFTSSDSASDFVQLQPGKTYTVVMTQNIMASILSRTYIKKHTGARCRHLMAALPYTHVRSPDVFILTPITCIVVSGLSITSHINSSKPINTCSSPVFQLKHGFAVSCSSSRSFATVGLLVSCMYCRHRPHRNKASLLYCSFVNNISLITRILLFSLISRREQLNAEKYWVEGNTGRGDSALH
ncbi:unnamed protein product [Periconia digitata]|uniref:Uncharacterized protein n=1 Tax=Periconia digitata TaxID=1303443 RepID=A0A9W4U949_9PLEO|nr:unnamed protein product [Periconia digitata]